MQCMDIFFVENRQKKKISELFNFPTISSKLDIMIKYLKNNF